MEQKVKGLFQTQQRELKDRVHIEFGAESSGLAIGLTYA